ncbi:MAG: phosphorylase [Rhodospirillaceae bacterium]|nr:phosphorylase [Rhodospirillaceae bacterium]
MRAGVVTGLAAEAATIRRALGNDPSFDIRCDGPGNEAAAKAARELIANGCDGLVSMGLAGGLKKSIESGTVIVASRIVDTDGSIYRTDPRWHRQVLRRLLSDDGVLDGTIVGAAAPVTSPEAKAALHAATDSDVVDMESAAVAAVAKEAGVPFIAIRAVADPARRNIPGAFLRAMKPSGKLAPMTLLRTLLRNPLLLFSGIRLATDAAAARSALRRVVPVLRRALAPADFGEE